MNYELAKKLKDAGFPHKHLEVPGGDGFGDYCIYQEYLEGHHICIPTLSELIEACGDSCDGVMKSRVNDCWISACEIKGRIGLGKTPEEACANLWLELNKK